ncbi:hypothetical protein FOZ60_009912 [Perkinsus olseni]|uniref:Uncharacterized protein n=1 Tax=Perkinsus olseni TaxID=32597 RepID=A0A7J6PME9_PEROL|nr:hypothetical protein FOZ60_009912 [Perkinsus olseni]
MGGVLPPIGHIAANGVLLVLGISLLITCFWCYYQPFYQAYFVHAHVCLAIIATCLLLITSGIGIGIGLMQGKDPLALRIVYAAIGGVAAILFALMGGYLCWHSITMYKLELDRSELTIIPSRDEHVQSLTERMYAAFDDTYIAADCQYGGYMISTEAFTRPKCGDWRIHNWLNDLTEEEPEDADHMKEWKLCMHNERLGEQLMGLWCRVNADVSRELGRMTQWLCAAFWILFVALTAVVVLTMLPGPDGAFEGEDEDIGWKYRKEEENQTSDDESAAGRRRLDNWNEDGNGADSGTMRRR